MEDMDVCSPKPAEVITQDDSAPQEEIVTVTGKAIGSCGTMGFFTFKIPNGYESEQYCMFRGNRIWINGEKVKGSNFKNAAKFQPFFKENLLDQEIKADVLPSEKQNQTFDMADGNKVQPTFFSKCVWKGDPPPPTEERGKKNDYVLKPKKGK